MNNLSDTASEKPASTTYPVFKGLGRKPTFFGVPTKLLFGAFMVVAVITMLAGLAWWGLLLVILPTIRGMQLGTIGLYSHIVHRRVNEYAQSDFPQAVAAQFDNAYRRTFDTRGLMVNDLYLTVLVHPVADPVMGTFASLEKADGARLALWQAESIDRLQNTLRALKAGLHRYDPEVLEIVHRNGHAFSEPASFLGYLISGSWQSVPVTRSRLRNTLPNARPTFSRFGEIGELRSIQSSRVFGMMELRDYPENTKPGHMDKLLALPYEYVLTQSWGSFTGAAARASLRGLALHMACKQRCRCIDDVRMMSAVSVEPLTTHGRSVRVGY